MVKITRDPLDEAAIRALVRAATHAATAAWSRSRASCAIMRATSAIRYLEYDAYPEMAEQQMATIAAEVERRWQTDHVAIVHRIGRLEIGECSVVGGGGVPPSRRGVRRLPLRH